MMAVQHLDIPAIKALLNAGANVQVKNSKEQNALMLPVVEFPDTVNHYPEDGPHIDFQDWGFLPQSC